MAPSPRPQKRNLNKRKRNVVISDLDAISEAGGIGDGRISSRSLIDSASVYPGRDQDSCSATYMEPTGEINGRGARGKYDEEQEVESPERFSTGTEQMCSSSVIHSSMGLIDADHEDAPPGFGFISQPTSSVRSSCLLQAIPDRKMFEDLLPSPVRIPRVGGSSAHASRAALKFSESTSKVEGSSVYAGLRVTCTALEDDILSTASFSNQFEGTYDTDNDAASDYHLESDTLDSEEVPERSSSSGDEAGAPP